jgi:hypothetical protein
VVKPKPAELNHLYTDNTPVEGICIAASLCVVDVDQFLNIVYRNFITSLFPIHRLVVLATYFDQIVRHQAAF